MSWKIARKSPYTKQGIARLSCIRCGGRASCQWQICSDGNNYRPLCNDCDIALNKAVLEFMKHPKPWAAIGRYMSQQRQP